MGRWAQQQRRGSVPSRGTPIEPPLITDWSFSIEFEDPEYVLYGQQLESPPAGCDGRRYRWRTADGPWIEGQLGDVIGTELTLDPDWPNVLTYCQMRWESTTLPGSPGMWSPSRQLPA